MKAVALLAGVIALVPSVDRVGPAVVAVVLLVSALRELDR